VGSLFENITLEGLFNKNLPKDIRGTLNSAFNLFGNLGMLVFTIVGGYLYDNVGPDSPFLIVSACDCLFALGIIVLILMGKFNH